MPGLKHQCQRVQKDPWELYDTLSAATLTLTGSKPTVSFRVAVTLSIDGAHNDCTGSVVVGDETITFTGAARKTTTNTLTALPVVTTSGLNCHVLIEAITVGGQPIYQETLTTITCRWSPTQKTFKDSMGNFSTSDAEVLTTNSTCNAGDTLRYSSVDYTVKQVNPYSKLSGREFLRRLFVVRG